MSRGIDYGLGKSNIDPKTGIRYGVISGGSFLIDDLAPNYGNPTCPKCGGEVVETCESTMTDDPSARGTDYACENCHDTWRSDECFGDDPLSWGYTGEGYEITSCLDSDYMVLRSPYYTLAAFCSPCVPGAGNLDSPCADGVQCYALGPEWFDGDKAPYPLWRVSDGTVVADS